MAAIEWQTRQACSECGKGAFLERIGLGYMCDRCEHLHPLMFSQLNEREEYWVDPKGYLWLRKLAA